MCHICFKLIDFFFYKKNLLIKCEVCLDNLNSYSLKYAEINLHMKYKKYIYILK